jgi:hypothetical protein
MNTPDTQGTPAPLSGNIALYCVASDSGCAGGCCHGAGGCACCCGGGGTAGGVLLETRVSAGRWGLRPPGNKKKVCCAARQQLHIRGRAGLQTRWG